MTGTATPTCEGPLAIGVLIPRLSGGGAEFVALQWADHLRRQGHDVVVITTHGTEDAAQDGVVALHAASFPARVLELRRHLADRDYDVLLSLMPHWNVLALLATRGAGPRPAVVISGRNVESALRTTQGTRYQLELAMSRLLYRRADGYVAISHPVAAEAASRYGLPIERIWVVPNPATGKTQDLASSGRRPSESSVTLTVPARLVRQKRPEVAVETAAVLRDRYGIRARVDYFGSGPEEALVRRTAQRLDVPVTFRGWVTSWFAEAAGDAVVLLPSTAEGFGNVLVEAAAAGVPSVTSSRALGTADAVVPHVTGVLTMGSDAEAYAAGVVEAMPLAPVRAPEWLAGFSPAASGAKLLTALEATVAASPGRRLRGRSRQLQEARA